jgi:oxygen-independent coproporphyrinogen-3 oxidase
VRNAGKTVTARLYENGEILQSYRAPIDKSDPKGICRATKLAIYTVLAIHTGHRPPWGLLTGIRPAKIAANLFDAGLSEGEARHVLKTYYLVEHDRAALCTHVARARREITGTSPKNSVSIYAAVPFCPSICRYCSFSAYPMDKYVKYADDYVTALIKEIEHLGRNNPNIYVENIYIGGGTPTALDDANFERLLAAIGDNFAVDNAMEYTVEAGRPDTITPEKLATMRRHGVSRISINPQTLNDATLEKIGRKHTAAQFIEAYKMARHHGFDHINIDLILGLPGETLDDANRTLEGIAALSPKSCTIHTLAVKRASKLHQEPEILAQAEMSQMRAMLDLSARYMRTLGLAPYYMYRQKNSPGNFENVGYAAPGYTGRYNIQMMEETQTILAAGAGAVTKLVDTAQNRIERIFNLRNPVEYLQKQGDS